MIYTKLSKYFKLTRIVHVHVECGGQGYLQLTLIPWSKLCNKLMVHLELVVEMYAQQFFNEQTFPYQLAISDWNAQRMS